MAFEQLSQNLANPTNFVQQSFDAKTQELEAKRAAEQKQRDDDFHTVVKYAGDGLVDEARYYAQQRGIEVPDAIYSNATFAKGLDISRNLYDDEPQKAQAFAQAFMSVDGDLNTRFNAALQAAGAPTSKSERDFSNFVRKEQWKLKNSPSGSSAGFTLAPGQTRYDAQGNQIAQAPPNASSGAGFTLGAGQSRYDAQGNLIADMPARPPISRLEAGLRAYNAALGGTNPNMAEGARQQAYQEWDAMYGAQANPVPRPQAPQPMSAPAPTAQQPTSQGAQAIQQLLNNGYTPQQIVDNLVKRGATEAQARALLQAAGVQ